MKMKLEHFQSLPQYGSLAISPLKPALFLGEALPPQSLDSLSTLDKLLGIDAETVSRSLAEHTPKSILDFLLCHNESVDQLGGGPAADFQVAGQTLYRSKLPALGRSESYLAGEGYYPARTQIAFENAAGSAVVPCKLHVDVDRLANWASLWFQEGGLTTRLEVGEAGLKTTGYSLVFSDALLERFLKMSLAHYRVQLQPEAADFAVDRLLLAANLMFHQQFQGVDLQARPLALEHVAVQEPWQGLETILEEGLHTEVSVSEGEAVRLRLRQMMNGTMQLELIAPSDSDLWPLRHNVLALAIALLSPTPQPDSLLNLMSQISY